jgi:hypothetical protein
VSWSFLEAPRPPLDWLSFQCSVLLVGRPQSPVEYPPFQVRVAPVACRDGDVPDVPYVWAEPAMAYPRSAAPGTTTDPA